jgi:putative ABC transport system permease protein
LEHKGNIMNIGQLILEALESLNSNKLRTGLTILGIVIGVAAVIAMLGVGQGASNSITNQINSLGTNLLFVSRSFGARGQTNPQPLTIADATALGDPSQAPDVAQVSPVINGNATLTAAGVNYTTEATGINANYPAMRNYTLSDGAFFTQNQITGRASVCVIGVDVANNLFNTTTGLVGQTIRMNKQPFTIVGVLNSVGGGGFGSADNIFLIPFTTAQVRLNSRNPQQVGQILVQATSANTVTAASDEITSILRARHHINTATLDFSVLSQASFVQSAQTITGTFTIFLGGVAGISLLVGGIGIMNIMLVSVTERTREIGLRKALGARKRDILVQFLTESAMLSLLGGLIGIGLGYIIAGVVGRIAAASGTNLTPAVGVDSILIATLFSTAIGVFFGIYPANRAAGLEPVEALRYE